jgi:hypothetical protein
MGVATQPQVCIPRPPIRLRLPHPRLSFASCLWGSLQHQIQEPCGWNRNFVARELMMADQSPSCGMRWESCTDPTLRRSGELEVQVETRRVAGSGRLPELNNLLRHCLLERLQYLADAILLGHIDNLMRRMLLVYKLRKTLAIHQQTPLSLVVLLPISPQLYEPLWSEPTSKDSGWCIERLLPAQSKHLLINVSQIFAIKISSLDHPKPNTIPLFFALMDRVSLLVTVDWTTGICQWSSWTSEL